MKRITQQFVAAVTAIALTLAMTGTAFAQGTQGIETFHDLDPFAPIVFIGGPNDPQNPFPIPIDLVPDGPPWIKHLTPLDPFAVSPILIIEETIVNIGDEPWYDWHEHVLFDGLPFPVPPVWLNVIDVTVDGIPIGFGFGGAGTPDLWLDNFTQPVLPGQILEITKELDVPPDYFLFAPELLIAEYPTPEPATLALMGLGALVVLRRR